MISKNLFFVFSFLCFQFMGNVIQLQGSITLQKKDAEKYILSIFDKMPYEIESEVYEKLSGIFEKFPSLIETRDAHGWTLLHEAAHKNNLEMADFLIIKGADYYAMTDGIGDMPLHLAARVHAWDIIRLLYFEYEVQEEMNDLDQYPFDHDCPLCPLKQFDLSKEVKALS